MTKAIIFDFHDTVIKNGLNLIIKKEMILSPETWKPFWRGEITEEEFWQKAATDINEDEAWIKESMVTYYSKSVPIKGILLIAKKLRQNYKLGLLGNCPKPWFGDAVLRFNLDKKFNVLVSSGETGLLKPEPEIYLLICQKLEVLPQECLYIDDDEAKLKTACDLGMKVILFRNPEQLAAELKNEEKS